MLILDGLYVSDADGAPPLSDGAMLLFNPAGTTHRDSFHLAQGRFLTLSLPEQTCRIATEGTGVPTASTAFLSGESLATALRLAQYCGSAEPEGSGVMEALCWELLSNVSGKELWPKRMVPSWARHARELLNDRSNGPLRIAEMAQELNLHPVYLARVFRRAFRCTPGEYLMRCRLRRAMALVRDTPSPLSEIALAAGFCDQSHFTKAFRRHFGASPRMYRTSLRAGGITGEVSSVQEPPIVSTLCSIR